MASPIFGAGFYYKTFMWPASFWEKLYEPMIRRAAGLGYPSKEPDPDTYEKMNAFCDVLVIGAGAAGLSAALAAARAGARVILCDEDFALGGRLLAERGEIDGQSTQDWAQSAIAELESLPNCRILRRTTVFGVYDGGIYAAVERVGDHLRVPEPHTPRQRLWRIVAKQSVLCAGAFERPIVFGDNDRPGVMLAGAVRTYVNRFGVTPGRSAVIFADNHDALRTATDLADAGVAVRAIVDPRPQRSAAAEQVASAAGALYVNGIIDGVSGAHGIKSVRVKDAQGATTAVPCDLLAVSGGWNPALNLTTHLGGKPRGTKPYHASSPVAFPQACASPVRRRANSLCKPVWEAGRRRVPDPQRKADSLPRRPAVPRLPKTVGRPRPSGMSKAEAARRSSIFRTMLPPPT
ncbi:hypothetical protein AUC70_00660 [Methyloceanibacter stevinii]|uniref:FAD/NAD(P)-binding domain-containing protein n=1 Tax=Methyloceanibacter stevinii TaxID=1774970 RepID=A0A1E3VRA1_9HYPH|nr:hypothetical protein AUC70_00660 [Methyloceanibacter stevinii]